MKGATLDYIIEEFGGLIGSCKFFGWQGGTIHQVKEEWTRRLHNLGYVINKEGIVVELRETSK